MLRIHHQPARTGAEAAAWIEVDLAAIRHNVGAFLRLLPPGCELVAVVKANAYGHGLLPVARTVLAAGASGLAVATVDEGATLRAAGLDAPILIAGPALPEQARAIAEHALVPAIGSGELAAALAAVARRPLPVEIEVDTGMRRHGLSPADAATLARQWQERGRLRLQGVFTHFRALGPDDKRDIDAQWRTFRRLATALSRGHPGLRVHACNTLGALVAPAAHADAVRIGGGLFGFDPLRGSGPVALRPALSLHCTVAGLRDVAAGDRVGYGGAFTAPRAARLALLPVGYADGLPRAAWTDAQVLIRGVRAPIVGLISMNQTLVDVSRVAAARAGDEVVLLGRQGRECIAAEDRTPAGTCVYETTTLLRADLPRRLRGEAPPGR